MDYLYCKNCVYSHLYSFFDGWTRLACLYDRPNIEWTDKIKNCQKRIRKI